MLGGTKAVVIGNTLAFVSSILYLGDNLSRNVFWDVQYRHQIGYPLFCLGTALALPLMVIIIRSLGHKIGIAISGVFNATALILFLAFDSKPATMMFTIFISGLAKGSVYISLISYYAEISNPKDRPVRIISVTIIDMLGKFTCELMIKWLPDVVLIFFTVWGVLFILQALIQLPESPYFLKRKNKPNVEEAIILLKGVCTKEDIQEIEDVLESKSVTSLKIYATVLLAMGSQFGEFNLFQTYHTGDLNEEIVVILVLYFFGLIVSCGISMVAKKAGIIIVSCVAILIIYIILITNASQSIFIAYFLSIFRAVGLTCIPSLLLIETTPLNAKPLNLAIYSTLAALMPFIYRVIIVSNFELLFKTDLTYAVMAMIFLCLLMAFFVPGTKGKTLGEIQKELSVK